VTIFGQSARRQSGHADGHARGAGLFNRAVVQSGSMLRMANARGLGPPGHIVLNELGLAAQRIERLHELPVETLVMAARAARRVLYRS
jgi:para-nitrobenzyl esterase